MKAEPWLFQSPQPLNRSTYPPTFISIGSSIREREDLPQRRQGAKVGAELNSFEECYLFLPNLASLRLGARNIRIRESSTSRKFARATTTFKEGSTEFTEDLCKLLFLGDFLCVLCASAVQTPIPASHKSLKNQTIRWRILVFPPPSGRASPPTGSC